MLVLSLGVNFKLAFLKLVMHEHILMVKKGNLSLSLKSPLSPTLETGSFLALPEVSLLVSLTMSLCALRCSLT